MPCQRFFSTTNSDVNCEVGGLIGPLGDGLGISASAAVESIHLKPITQSASYLYTSRHWEFSFLNFQTIQFYFLISSPAFLSKISALQISSELLGSPPTAIPSTPPNNRTNSLIISPNLNYRLTASACMWSTDVDPYIASKTNPNPPPAFLCCVCDSRKLEMIWFALQRPSRFAISATDLSALAGVTCIPLYHFCALSLSGRTIRCLGAVVFIFKR